MEKEKKKEFPEENEILLCTVNRTVGPSVFITLDDYNKEGVIPFSEVAPGRIRNIRDYIKIGQKIVCKVLRVDELKGHVDLSLRRVTKKEKKEVVTAHKRAKEALVMLGLTTNKTRAEQLAKTINEKLGKLGLAILLQELTEIKSEESLSKLKTFGFSQEEAKNFLDIISEKIKEKKVIVKTKISLSSKASDGIEKIKKVFETAKPEKKVPLKISYLGAPNYLITLEGKNYKEANKNLKELCSKITTKAKELHCDIEIKEK